MASTPSPRIRSLTHLKITTLKHSFIESAPKPLEEGVLYISIRFKTALHLCCCGCGNEVVTPLSPAKWTLLFHGVSVSLAPSVGSWNLPCKSHYWIKENHVIACEIFTEEEISKNRLRDAAKSAAYHSGALAKETEKQSPEGFFKRFFKF